MPDERLNIDGNSRNIVGGVTNDTNKNIRPFRVDPITNRLLVDTNSDDVCYIKFDADDTQPTYIGLNNSVTAADADVTWTIYNFTYSGTATTSIKRVTGAWSDRANLF